MKGVMITGSVQMKMLQDVYDQDHIIDSQNILFILFKKDFLYFWIFRSMLCAYDMILCLIPEKKNREVLTGTSFWNISWPSFIIFN